MPTHAASSAQSSNSFRMPMLRRADLADLADPGESAESAAATNARAQKGSAPAQRARLDTA
ncbi:hypothetical protein WS86_28550 [Burkholderia savannae]|nr:hypothetical protein WS86_28550 [Burkholderia savannae]